MKSAIVAIIFASVASVAFADAPVREINVTSDSAAGWLPSADQERWVRKTVEDFLAALDSGRAADAYALMGDGMKADLPFPGFKSDLAKFNKLAGPMRERRIVKVTWTKAPRDGEGPGVYAAVDLVSRFAEIDRHCGYLVVFQAPGGGAFKIMRQEASYFANAQVRRVERARSRLEVDSLWSELSARCPNYPRAELEAFSAPIPETDRPAIGYSSVQEALSDLKSRSDVTFSEENGWVVATVPAESTVWTFPPKGHSAYPSAVRRQIKNGSNGADMHMSVHCEASKAACDELVRTFQTLNRQIANSLKGR